MLMSLKEMISPCPVWMHLEENWAKIQYQERLNKPLDFFEILTHKSAYFDPNLQLTIHSSDIKCSLDFFGI